MRRAPIPLAVTAVAATTLVALSGCGNVDADAVRAEFAGRAGVVEARTSCDQNLPFMFDCEVTVNVGRDITEAQLTDILPLMRTGLHGARGVIAVEWRSSGDPDLEIRFRGDGSFTPGVSDETLAEAFVEGIADPRITEFVLSPYALSGKRPLAKISYQNPEENPDAASAEDGQNDAAIASMRRVQELIPGTTVEVTTPDLSIDAPNGSVPEAELDLYLAIARVFPLIYAQVEQGLLDVRLDRKSTRLNSSHH